MTMILHIKISCGIAVDIMIKDHIQDWLHFGLFSANSHSSWPEPFSWDIALGITKLQPGFEIIIDYWYVLYL